ncbi:hypothetical protein F5148DRAFT_1165976 [Russula earlei]|uniref:Uncharacterized protein n=1 Tax=Russula earlei TaxID=71964 RepID=A0ACC0UK90_9AGAM|nr:hypothetical protein F5148DRAFT_1165976 [Russula earlei]
MLSNRPRLQQAEDDSHQGVALYRDPPHTERDSFRMPMTYSNPLADFNNWDTMFMERLVGGITLHNPDVPPEVVLALGNGFDFWAIHAAQTWPKCRIMAHSLLGMYKEGMNALIRSMRLADRVAYVRGDPSRDLSLDYPSNTFDMVRLSYCSLNLAETEWYVFLQEINRVLKPGGVLEVIDEDLHFPGHKSPEPEPQSAISPAQQLYPPSDSVPPLSAGPDSRFLRAPDIYSADVRTIPSPTPTDTLYSDGWNLDDASFSLKYSIDPVDHSRLTRAWHEMLSSRWISASITRVLPFYLSAIFQTFRALPSLKILIRPSTLCPLSSASSEQMFDPEPFRRLGHATVKDDVESSATWMSASEAPPHFIPSQSSMHLARMVAIVTSCKEAIWDAYNQLYSKDRRLPLLNNQPGRSSLHTIREEFESHWLNWECHMRSRIDMASNTKQRLQWVVRMSPRPDPDSDYGRWLKGVKRVQSEKYLAGLASPGPVKPEVIRCVRGFVAWKFSGSVTETRR